MNVTSYGTTTKAQLLGSRIIIDLEAKGGGREGLARGQLVARLLLICEAT